MLENKFFHLFITIVWISGLLGILLTLTHAWQVRNRYQQHGISPWRVPRILAPLYGSLATFCIGLALHAFAAQHTVSLWIAAIWAGLAALFLTHLVAALGDARAGGGVDPIAEPRGWHVFGTGLVLVLLLANAGLVGWWGSTQIVAGQLRLPTELSLEIGSSEVPSTTTVSASPADQAQASDPGNAERAAATPASLSTNTTNTRPVGHVPITSTPPVTNAPQATPTPDSLAVPPSTPAAPVAAAPQASLTVRNAGGANVRVTPTLDGEIITILADGTVVPVLGRTADNQWIWVDLGQGASGWVSATVIELNGAMEAIPAL